MAFKDVNSSKNYRQPVAVKKETSKAARLPVSCTAKTTSGVNANIPRRISTDKKHLISLVLNASAAPLSSSIRAGFLSHAAPADKCSLSPHQDFFFFLLKIDNLYCLRDSTGQLNTAMYNTTKKKKCHISRSWRQIEEQAEKILQKQIYKGNQEQTNTGRNIQARRPTLRQLKGSNTHHPKPPRGTKVLYSRPHRKKKRKGGGKPILRPVIKA